MPTSLPRERLASLLADAPRTRIAILGDAMLDLYLMGDAERISPEAPVPIVRVRERKLALGGAANVAQNVAALGATAELVAAIGRDQAGEALRDMLRLIGADPRALVELDRPTTTKTRVLARGQQIVRFDEEDDTDVGGPSAERILAAAYRAIDEADALVFEDYNKGVLVPAVITGAIERARARGIPIVVDPKFRNFFSYPGVTVFKPNRREIDAAFGATADLEHPETLQETFRALKAEHLLLTLSEKGMLLLSASGAVRRIPTTARAVFDSVGAGDTVTAFLATMLAAGASVTEAAIIANFAAGVEVGKLGAATVSAEEVLQAYDEYAERMATAGG